MIESVAPAVAAPSLPVMPDRCVAEGQLINKSGCFALRQSNGDDIWLEMDRIPMHLIEQQVQIKGWRFQANFISVESVGPL